MEKTIKFVNARASVNCDMDGKRYQEADFDRCDYDGEAYVYGGITVHGDYFTIGGERLSDHEICQFQDKMPKADVERVREFVRILCYEDMFKWLAKELHLTVAIVRGVYAQSMNKADLDDEDKWLEFCKNCQKVERLVKDGQKMFAQA